MNDVISLRFEVSVYKDGDQWCCLYGPNLQMGAAGFAADPNEAVAACAKMISDTVRERFGVTVGPEATVGELSTHFPKAFNVLKDVCGSPRDKVAVYKMASNWLLERNCWPEPQGSGWVIMKRLESGGTVCISKKQYGHYLLAGLAAIEDFAEEAPR
jgi:hypothetical protein